MLPTDFAIHRIDRSGDPILRNLLELYCHDMNQWFLYDTDENGLYNYPMQRQWDAGVQVHLAYAAQIPIGFALIGSATPFTGDERALDLDEFFVVRRHRRAGVGRAFVRCVWDAYPGPWLVRVFQGNLPALPFWRATISEYTAGAFAEEVREVGKRRWSYFTFEAPDGAASP